jgi:hypothetical protein
MRSASLIIVLSTVALLSLAFAGPSSALASEAPVAAYSFDEGEGEVAEDSAGEHDGALEHTEWVKGKYGSAVYLDGNNDFVSIADAPDLDLSEEFTLEAWVRPDSAQTDAPVIEKRTSNFYSYKLLAGGETAGVPEGFVADAPFSWEEVADEDPLTNKAWSHLAMTYDGAAIRLYVNGKLVDTNSAPGAQGSEGNLIIGGEETEDFFKGRIDEVRIYDRALDGGEVAADKATPIQTPRTGPIAAYSFDEGEGEVAEDSAGEHDGTIEGAEWARGKYGSALKFNAEDGDVVKVPVSEDFEVEEFTLQAWVRPEEDLEYAPVVANTSSGFGYSLYAGGDGGYLGHPEARITEDRWGETVSTVADPPALPLNAWSHLTATYDGAFLRLYINGELVDTDDAPSVIAGEGELQIGGDEDWSAAGFFDGRIDEVRIYDRALDGGEVDSKPPTSPGKPEAVLEDEEGDLGIYWAPSQDQPSINTGVTVGVTRYLYRLQRPESGWTSWTTIPSPFFELENGVKGEHIQVEILAIDAAENRSSVTRADVLVEESTLTPEDIGEEAEPNEWKRVDVYEEPPPPKEPGEQTPSKSEYFQSSQPPPTGTNELCENELENPCGQYHPRLAAQYAYKWIDEDHENTYYNHEFLFFGGAGGDCTNFTSQILWAGGMRFMRTNGYNEPDMEANGEDHFGSYDYGHGSWWEGYFYYQKQLKLFRTPTESFVNAQKLLDHLVEYGLVTFVPKHTPVKKGDIIFYNEHGTSPAKVGHSQTIISVTPHRIWVGQHSSTYIATLRSVRRRVNEDRGPQGKAWEYFIYRPVHTQANLNM